MFKCPLPKVMQKWWGSSSNWLEIYLKNQPESIDYNSGIDMKENINVKELFLAHRFPLREKPDPRLMIEARVAQRGDTMREETTRNVAFEEHHRDEDEASDRSDGGHIQEVEREDDRSESDESKQTDD